MLVKTVQMGDVIRIGDIEILFIKRLSGSIRVAIQAPKDLHIDHIKDGAIRPKDKVISCEL